MDMFLITNMIKDYGLSLVETQYENSDLFEKVFENPNGNITMKIYIDSLFTSLSVNFGRGDGSSMYHHKRNEDTTKGNLQSSINSALSDIQNITKEWE